MDKQVRDFVTEKTRALLASATCCKEAKEAAESWLAAAGTDKEAEETRKYLAELEEDIVSIGDLIGLAESEMGQKIFGENAKNVAEEGRQAKAAGAKYCFCDARKAVEAILSKKAEMLA